MFFEAPARLALGNALRRDTAGAGLADDVKRPEIESPQALKAWLADKPAEWARAIAVRAALRVFPLVLGVYYFPENRLLDRKLNSLILKSFRVAFSSYYAERYYNFKIINCLNGARGQYLEADHISFFSNSIFVAFSWFAESIFLKDDASSKNAATAALAAIEDAVNGFSLVANLGIFPGEEMVEVWRAVSEDCHWLLTHEAGLALNAQPLWPDASSGNVPSDSRFVSSVRNLMDRFSAEDEVKNSPWGLVVDWYRTILPEPNTAIPRRLFDETADTIATQPEAFWTLTDDRSAEDVLRDIERIVASHSEDAASRPVVGDEALADGEVLRTDAVPTHLDEPTGDDHLGRRPFARALVERMIEVKQASGRDGFAIHLHAPWGAGKTFILRMMDAMLRQPEQKGKSWIVVHFNAWEHERRKPPWWPMIEALKDGCVACLDTSHHWLKAEAVKRLWRTWILLAEGPPYVLGVFAFALLVSVAAWGGGELIKLGTAVFTIFMALLSAVVLLSRRVYFGSADGSKLYFDLSRDPMKKISELFRDIVDTADESICIFIDDLDRCNADYVVDLLEGIQTSFRHRSVTYVVAADRAWIRASFEQRYSNFSRHVGNPGQPLGYLFLEKIFQVSTPVPGMGGVKQRYWKHLLAGEAETRKADTDEVAESWASKSGNGYQKESVLPTAIFDEKVRVRREEIRDEFGDELSEADVRILLSKASTETDRVATILNYSESEGTTREAEHLLLKFSEFLPDNPRVMKRMVNSYKFRRVIGYLESNSVGHEVLARWTILEQRFPALADLLIEHPEWADMLAEGMEEGTDMPQALQPFAGDKDVIKVLGEPGSEHPLREKVIATITRGSAT